GEGGDGARAARAGIKRGDLVVAFDDKPVTDTRTLQRMVGAAPVEQDARLTLLGPAGRRALRVRLAPMPPDVLGERVAAEFGFVMRDSEGQVPRAASGPSASTPTVSVGIRGGPAAQAGLEVRDRPLQAGETAV